LIFYRIDYYNDYLPRSTVSSMPNKHEFNYPRDTMPRSVMFSGMTGNHLYLAKYLTDAIARATRRHARFSQNLWTAHVGAYTFPKRSNYPFFSARTF